MDYTSALSLEKEQNAAVRGIVEQVIQSGSRTFFLTSPIIRQQAKSDPFWSRPMHESKLHFILDSIIRQRIGVARIKGRRSAHVNLHSKVTEQFCTTRHSTEAKRFLLKRRIIESDYEYEPGVKARGYRPTEVTWKAGICIAPIYPGQIEKYNRIHRGLKENKNKDVEVTGVDLNYLTSHLLRLKLPRETILRELERDYQGVIETGDWRKAEAFHAKAFQVGAIVGHDWTFSRCVAGRLHYPLTNLEKGIRHKLRYRRKRLIEADVSCCQPLIASTLYPEGENYSAERHEYLRSVQSGLFYEELGRRAEYTGSRGNLKRDVLKWVFFGGRTYTCKNEIRTTHPLWQAFLEMFPLLARVLLFSKAEIQNSENSYRGDRDLAIRLQKKEAEIFIDGVLREMAENYAEIPAFPIHDCVMTTSDQLNLISSLIRAEFGKRLGIEPKVKGEGGGKGKRNPLCSHIFQ